jgi:hypothetical protein
VLNVFTLLLKTVNKIKQKNSFFLKKLLHSYLLLKGAQCFYTFADISKLIKAEKQFFSKKVTS